MAITPLCVDGERLAPGMNAGAAKNSCTKRRATTARLLVDSTNLLYELAAAQSK